MAGSPAPAKGGGAPDRPPAPRLGAHGTAGARAPAPTGRVQLARAVRSRGGVRESK